MRRYLGAGACLPLHSAGTDEARFSLPRFRLGTSGTRGVWFWGYGNEAAVAMAATIAVYPVGNLWSGDISLALFWPLYCP